MTIAEKIFALWSADTAAKALVPVAKFKYAGPYQGITAPYVIYFPVVEQRYRTIAEGAIGSLKHGEWQFSIYASSASSADTIVEKLVTIYDGNKGGFNFQFRNSRFVDETPDKSLVLVAVDFFVSSN